MSYGDEDEDDEDEDEDESTPSEESETESKADDNEVSMADVSADIDAVVKAAEGDQPKRERKRKRKDDHEDLEAKYLNKLAEEDEPAEPAEKRQKGDGDDAGEEDDDDDEVPVHETLAKDAGASDIEKATRTVFLANVSVEAISSKAAKKTLTTHLASVLDTEATPPEKIESIRFRSVAFAGGSMPKRAAYITKTLMDATTKSANAYVVYTTAAAARNAATKLNGTEVLGRHIRADSVAHPSPTDHRRCVFVGNLGFVDDETVLKTNADGETTEKKRNKVPADIEEGLWRTFGTQGRKVENVRVVRDSRTRVGKGFAYVQFYVSFLVPLSLSLCRYSSRASSSLFVNSRLTKFVAGYQRRRIGLIAGRKEVPPHAASCTPCDPSQGPSQDGPRSGANQGQGPPNRRCAAQHQVQGQGNAGATIHGRSNPEVARPICRGTAASRQEAVPR